MAKHCANHPKEKATTLCMGCGQYYCDACTTQVRDIKYCHKCEDVVGTEYAKLKERHDIDSSLPGSIHSFVDEEKPLDGKKSKSRSTRPEVNPKQVNALKGVPLKGIIAGVGKRIGARIIDLAIFLAVLIGGGAFGAYTFRDQIGMEDEIAALALGASAGFFLGFLLRVWMLTSAGATLGRMALGLKVVTARGKYISSGTGFGRAVVETLEMLPGIGIPILSVVSLVKVKPAERSGSFADSVTNTLVVDRSEWHRRALAQVTAAGKKRKEGEKAVARKKAPPAAGE